MMPDLKQYIQTRMYHICVFDMQQVKIYGRKSGSTYFDGKVQASNPEDAQAAAIGAFVPSS